HRAREALGEEIPDRLTEVAPGAVDGKVGARGERLQVLEQVAIQRDRSRHRERRQRGPIEHRQPGQVVRAQPRQPLLLQSPEQGLQPTPGGFALSPKGRALEGELRPGAAHAICSRRLMSMYRLTSWTETAPGDASMQRMPIRRSWARTRSRSRTNSEATTARCTSERRRGRPSASPSTFASR